MSESARVVGGFYRPYVCPVCLGKGLVGAGFYLGPGPTWGTTSTTPEKCRSCSGTGIVRA